ncbi:MAG: DotU family type IV/VI secretion system protein [Desulfamplus sp.]|nr:DotU family type IV/VI secretion system protein [Desulfamplus sp.]
MQNNPNNYSSSSRSEKKITPNHETNRLHQNIIIASCQPIFEYILQMRSNYKTGKPFPMDEVRNECLDLLKRMETNLLKYPKNHSRLDIVKYIITSLIDEIIIFSAWTNSDEWQAHPLEMELFGKSVAGERFFELLESYGYRDPELAELFYICLSIGFDRKIVQEKEYKQRLYALIINRLPEDERRLSPGAEEAIVGDKVNLPPMFGYMTVAIVLVVAIFVYVVASQMLWNDASEFINNLSATITKGY